MEKGNFHPIDLLFLKHWLLKICSNLIKKYIICAKVRISYEVMFLRNRIRDYRIVKENSYHSRKIVIVESFTNFNVKEYLK